MSLEIVHPRATGFFIRSLNSSRKEIVELTFEDAAKLAKDGETMFESLKDGEFYTFFTDCDHYCEGIEPPDDDYVDDVKDRMMNNLGKLVNEQFTDEHKGTFGMATRHGVHVEKKVYKLSWRCYFFGFVMTLSGMREVIVRKGLDKAGIGSLDSSPYNKNQLLGCVGFAKSTRDKRVLVPCDASQPLEKFMVQNVTGDETILNYDGENENENEDGNFEDILEVSDETGNFEHSRFAPSWEILELLVMNLDVQKRCEGGTYQQWARVGWAIAGVARAARRFEDGLKLWLQFCRLCMGAYLENPMKAQIIYRCAKNRNVQLGWTSLMEALKEDNFKVYEDIRGQISPLVEDEEAQKTIQQFVKTFFRRPVKTIDKIVMRNFDGVGFVIVTLNDNSSCDFVDDNHEDGSKNYIVIGLKKARDKCPHAGCAGKENIVVENAVYPEALKRVLLKLIGTSTPADAIGKLLGACDTEDAKKMDLTEFGVRKSSLLFGDRYDLVKNTYCPIHRCHHDSPENCIMMSQDFQRLGIVCHRDPFGSIYPGDGITVPANIINVFIQHRNSEEQTLDDEIFDEEFGIFPDTTLNHLVNVSLKGFASDIARVFVHLGRDIFGVQSGDKDVWLAWDNRELRWMQSEHKANIFCDSVLADIYVTVMQWLRQHTPDNDKRSKRLQKIEYLLKRLKDRDQYSILKQAAILLKEEKRNFEFLLDSNKDVMNFQGQVYDFETLEIRTTRPSDLVSLTTGYALPQADSEKRTQVMSLIRSIMPDEIHVNYLLLHLAGCLDGWNREEVFHILTGTGRNGKGILSLLMEHALGNTGGYFKDIKANLLTKERPSADKPAPELLNMKGKRLIVASEPEAGSRINVGFLKFLTGNDPLGGRWLHGNTEVSFSPQHCLWLLCNSIPSLDAHDEAVWDRSRVLEFPFHFVDNPEHELERKIDRTIKRRIPKLAPQLMLIILEAYGKYKREGLAPSPRMLDFTKTVRNANDIYVQFVDECVDVTLCKEHRIRKGDLEKLCKDWIAAQSSNKIVVNKDTLFQTLTNKGAIWKNSVRIAGWAKPQQGFQGARIKIADERDVEILDDDTELDI